MRFSRLLCALALGGLVSAAPSAVPAAEPEPVSRAFEVTVIQGSAGPEVEVTFALALSEVPSYPVTITAIGGAVEEQLWNGTLQEGVYRFRAPLTKIKSGPLRLILKAKVTNRTEGGAQSFLSYQRWDGSTGR